MSKSNEKTQLSALEAVVIDISNSDGEPSQLSPPKIRRQATWSGKYYQNSHECAPRENESYEYKGEIFKINVDVRAPAWVKKLTEVFSEIKTEDDKFIWKECNYFAGKEWMLDILWANLSKTEREHINTFHLLAIRKWPDDHGLRANCLILHWIQSQLSFNFPNCLKYYNYNHEYTSANKMYYEIVSAMDIRMPPVRRFTKGAPFSS